MNEVRQRNNADNEHTQKHMTWMFMAEAAAAAAIVDVNTEPASARRAGHNTNKQTETASPHHITDVSLLGNAECVLRKSGKGVIYSACLFSSPHSSVVVHHTQT